MGKQDHLGEFEQLVLLAVMRLGAEAYGASIQEVLEGMASREASISAIYITLTEDATAALNESRSKLLAMWDGLESELEAAGGSRE